MRGISPALAMVGLLLAGAAVCPPVQAGPEISFLHSLSDFHGPIPYGPARLFVDGQHDELYVAESNVVRIFNPAGMEVFWFGFDSSLGMVRDLAVDESGEVFLLATDVSDPLRGGVPYLARCNYRGEFAERIDIQGLPAGFESFQPSTLALWAGKFYLVSASGLRVAVVDRQGNFREGFDLAELIQLEPGRRADAELYGFSLDPAGNMLFSIPVLFRVFLVSPEMQVRSFGKPGSAPGSFGIVGGVAADDDGRIFVSDRLRSVVMVFDKDFKFLEEFGGVGNRPENLVRPGYLALGSSGRLFVTQLRNRGVSVFSVRLP